MDDEYSKVYEYLLTGAYPIGYTKNEKRFYVGKHWQAIR